MKKQLFLTITLMMLSIFTAAIAQSDNSKRRGTRFSNWSTPVNLGSPINSPANENSAVILKDGLTLYFTSDRNGSAGEDIWVSKRRNKNSRWGKPVNLGAVVNSASTDRLRSISSDGRILLFQSNRPGVGANDIWVTTRRRTNDDFSWGTPVNLGTVINTNANEIAANYLFSNQSGNFETRNRNQKLFFSSSRQGGIGDADIYESEIPFGGSFGQPVNILELNSQYTEACIWVRDDGLELLFSSTRAAFDNNVDSFDLWVSTRESVDDKWSPPVSLGATINVQGKRDVGPSLSADWQTMYFTSNRDGGLGGTDIYMTTRRRLRGNE
jgi:Tol biopolymer transport system component